MGFDFTVINIIGITFLTVCNNWTLLRLLLKIKLYLSINVFATGVGFHPDIRSGPTVSQFVRGGYIGKQR